MILKKPKTDSTIRKVWLPKTLAYILREWKNAQDELRGFLGDEYQDYDLVVALPNGRPCEDRICLLYTSARSRWAAGRGTAPSRFSSLAAASNRMISLSCPRRNFSLSLD